MIDGFSDVILITKILLTFLWRIDWETLSKLYKFGNLPDHECMHWLNSSSEFADISENIIVI
jgi:hypothetical protein